MSASAPWGSPFLAAHRDTAAVRLPQHRAMHGWARWVGRKGFGVKKNVTILGNASAEAISIFQALNSWTKGWEQITAVSVPQSKAACV